MCNTKSRLEAFLFVPKMRIDIILLAGIIFFALQARAYAQASFSVSCASVTQAAGTSNTAYAGDIVFTQTSGTSSSGTITITYPVPITSDYSSIIDVTGTGRGCNFLSVNSVWFC